MTKTKRKILCDKGESLGAPLATELVQPLHLPASTISDQPRASGKAHNSLQLHVCCPGRGHGVLFCFLIFLIPSDHLKPRNQEINNLHNSEIREYNW